jgi:hypothetical protein
MVLTKTMTPVDQESRTQYLQNTIPGPYPVYLTVPYFLLRHVKLQKMFTHYFKIENFVSLLLFTHDFLK